MCHIECESFLCKSLFEAKEIKFGGLVSIILQQQFQKNDKYFKWSDFGNICQQVTADAAGLSLYVFFLKYETIAHGAAAIVYKNGKSLTVGFFDCAKMVADKQLPMANLILVSAGVPHFGSFFRLNNNFYPQTSASNKYCLNFEWSKQCKKETILISSCTFDRSSCKLLITILPPACQSLKCLMKKQATQQKIFRSRFCIAGRKKLKIKKQ